MWWCELGLGTRYYDIQWETVSESGPAAEIKRQNTAKWKCWRILRKLWQKCGGKNNTIAAVLGITQHTIQHTIAPEIYLYVTTQNRTRKKVGVLNVLMLLLYINNNNNTDIF